MVGGFSGLRAGLVAAIALATGSAYADRVHMAILFNGSPAGENIYEEDASGAFVSSTTLKLGSIDLSGTIKGQFKDGKLGPYEAQLKTPNGPVKLSYTPGKVEVSAGDKNRSVPFEDTTGLVAGNVHPQFTSRALLAVEKVLQANPGVKETVLQAYLLDAAVVLPIKVSILPARSLTVDGKAETARRFNVNFGGVLVEYALNDANHVVGMDVPAQKLRFIADGWDALYEDPLAKYPELSQPSYKVKTESGVKARMRDGTELVCDVIRPDDNEKHPAILVRTPYGRGPQSVEGAFWARRGYIFISQDCRGRSESGGTWDPFVNEGKDGYDTIQWIAAQPWSDGKVGMIGGSYAGYVQWAAAVERPPALKCIVPQVSPPDAMHNLPYEYGTFMLYLNLWWARVVADKEAALTNIQGALPHPEALTTLPLSKADDAVLGRNVEFFDRWLERPTMKDWKGFDFSTHMRNVSIPALHISGTWDGDGIGTHLNWEAMRQLGRQNQWLIFGPWTHAFNTTHNLGDTEYGPDAILELDSVYLRWFDTWLKDKNVGQARTPHVRLFVAGAANKWVDLPDYPAPTATKRTLFLGKDKLVSKPGEAAEAPYTYDPAKDTKIPEVYKKPNPEEATTKVPPLEGNDWLLFKSDPFEKATAISGPFNVRLEFKTSAQDTDFFADLVDIAPDGEMRIIGLGGKVRASYLQGVDKVRPLTPGKAYIANLIPWDFAHELAAGHRLGLLLRSSAFPMYARNLGTAEPIATATRMVAQNNTILMGKGHPSAITFHVLWEK